MGGWVFVYRHNPSECNRCSFRKINVVRVYVCVHARVCVYVCVRERESERKKEREREREREKSSGCTHGSFFAKKKNKKEKNEDGDILIDRFHLVMNVDVCLCLFVCA